MYGGCQGKHFYFVVLSENSFELEGVVVIYRDGLSKKRFRNQSTQVLHLSD